MNRREMVKMAYQAPPKNEVVDEIDMLFKKAAVEDWANLLMSDKGISTAINRLPDSVRGEALKAMSQGVSNSEALGKALSPIGISSLQSGGYLPSGASSKLGQRALGATTKALGAAAPIMLAGAGLYGLSGLINYVKEKSKAKKFEAAKANAFESLAKDPALRDIPKNKLRQVFDLYADVSPLVTEHPILASSVLQELGGLNTAVNTGTLKSLGDLYNSKMKTEAELAKAKNLGWTSVSSDPTKIRALIRE
jgi:hypothetical protein